MGSDAGVKPCRHCSAADVTAAEAGGDRRAWTGRTLAACAAIVLAPVSRTLARIDDRAGGSYAQHTIVFAVDVALAVLAVQAARDFRSVVGRWRDHACALSAALLVVGLLPGFAAHPTDRGAAALLRLLAVAALASLLPRLPDLELRVVLTTIAAVVGASAAVAAAQRVRHHAVGLGALGEDSVGVLDIGSGVAPFGLFVHPYVMAAWALVLGLGLVGCGLLSRRWRTPLALALVGLVPVGLSLGRSAALGAVLAIPFLLWLGLGSSPRRRSVATAGAALLALLVGVLWNLDAWTGRVGGTVSSPDPSTERTVLASQAIGLLRPSPVVGVGPGNYVLALDRRPDLQRLSRQSIRPVHDVPLLVVTEGGGVVAPFVILLAVAVAWQAWRGGPFGMMITACYAPILLLDHLAWTFPQGLVLTGLWLGMLDLAAAHRHRLSERPPAPA